MIKMTQMTVPRLPSAMTSRHAVRAIVIAMVFATFAPHAFAADVFQGRETYALHCEGCHGADGRSIEPGVPDFSMGDALFQPDADLFAKIRKGTDTMPAFRGVLNDSEVRDVIAYLRSLRK